MSSAPSQEEKVHAAAPEAVSAAIEAAEGAPAPSAATAPADSEILYIQLGDLGQQPALTRFVIEAQPEAAEFYAEQWLLGPDGNARFDAGIDIPLPKDVEIKPGELVKVDLKVRARCFNLFWNWGASPGVPRLPPVGQPTGYWLVPRSSIAQMAKAPNWADGSVGRSQRTLHMPNAPGLMDPGYTGPVIVQIMNLGMEIVQLKRGEAVVQIASPMLAATEYCSCAPGSALAELAFKPTARGAGGFGSTGAAGSSTAAAQAP